MDNQFNDYINKLVDTCLAAPAYANLPEDQKPQAREKLEDHLNMVVINSLIDSLSEDQLSQVENLDPEGSEIGEKFQEFASQIPGFAYVIEEKLQQAVKDITEGRTTV